MQFIKNLPDQNLIGKFKITFLGLLLLFITLPKCVFAQQSTQSILNLERKAEDYFENQKFYKAEEIYEKLDSINPNTPDYMYNLAVCYIDDNKPYKAKKYFDKCLRNPTRYPKALFLYAGKTYHQLGEFKTAINLFNIYKSKLEQKKRNLDIIISVNREIQKCKNGIEFTKDPLDIELKCLSDKVNSKYPEHSPQISNNEKTVCTGRFILTLL